MKSISARRLSGFLPLLLLALLALAAAPAPTASNADPEHLIVLSTSDVKGKTSPCGCHTPKGGFARRAAYFDSVRAEHDQILIVDAGGYFPEAELEKEAGPFCQQLMAQLGTQAVGVGERDLRYGLAFMREGARAARLPVTCANLYEKPSGKLVFPSSIVTKAGRVTVGVFAVISDHVDLGPARDSLRVEDPMAAAVRTVAQLKKQGATVIVMLSQLGKVEGEDLASSVEGIDVAILGRDVTMLQKGRLIKNTVAAYSGEQGWYVGFTKVTLDAARRMATAENDMSMLGPDVPNDAKTLAQVKTFEDKLNERLRLAEKKRAAESSVAGLASVEDQAEHYIGAEMCARCHQKEYQQWQTTPHARAWATLVDQKKDATPECVKCHVLGYEKPGGFRNGDDAPRLANVQCENCHGMGTEHDAMKAAAQPVNELTCRGCHDATSSPTFDFALYRPHVLHTPPPGLKPLPESPAAKLMREHGTSR